VIINTNQNLSDEDIENLFVTAIEGGINYWAMVDVYRPSSVYAKVYAYEEDKFYVIDREVIIKGVQLIASQKDNFNLTEFIENHDANDADWVVQLGLFGELTYS
jgi:hypothetical protein